MPEPAAIQAWSTSSQFTPINRPTQIKRIPTVDLTVTNQTIESPQTTSSQSPIWLGLRRDVAISTTVKKLPEPPTTPIPAGVLHTGERPSQVAKHPRKRSIEQMMDHPGINQMTNVPSTEGSKKAKTSPRPKPGFCRKKFVNPFEKYSLLADMLNNLPPEVEDATPVDSIGECDENLNDKTDYEHTSSAEQPQRVEQGLELGDEQTHAATPGRQDSTGYSATSVFNSDHMASADTTLPKLTISNSTTPLSPATGLPPITEQLHTITSMMCEFSRIQHDADLEVRERFNQQEKDIMLLKAENRVLKEELSRVNRA